MAQDGQSDIVNERYSEVARKGTSKSYSREVALAFGYTEDLLDGIPDESNMGLSCGNPIAMANLRPGEVVVDLGSGGGLDVFLAAAKVGTQGVAIGIDFSKDMIELARRNAGKRRLGRNVRFELGSITELPLKDRSVDCIISNCVINLIPRAQKQEVFKEMYRVLKVGGRVSISDILARQPLPDPLRQDIASYVGCVSGAEETWEYRKMFLSAGFPDAILVDTKSNLNVYKSATSSGECCGISDNLGGLSPALQYEVNEYVGSFQIYAKRN